MQVFDSVMYAAHPAWRITEKYGVNDPACKSARIINKAEEEIEMAVVKKGELPSVIHNN